MTAKMTHSTGADRVVVVLTPSGEWVCVGRNPQERKIPEGRVFNLYDRQGARLVMPKGAIKMAKQLEKKSRPHIKA